MKRTANHHRPFSTSLAVAVGALAIGLACAPPGPPTGIYIECDSNGKNTYTKWHPNQPCEDAQGNVFLGCKGPAPAENLAWCYEPDEWLASDTGVGGETGGEDPGHGIYRSGWPTHEPSLTYIKDRCTAQCTNLSPNDPYDCDQDDWTLFGYKAPEKAIKILKLATQLSNPGQLTCVPWYSKNHVETSPTTTTVVTSGTTPVWPLDGQPIALSCSNFARCSDMFDAPVLPHLQRSIGSLPGPNESEADYLATATTTSASNLTLMITNPGGTSTDANSVEGRVEYSAPVCGEATCPIYLGNLTLTNVADTWTLDSDQLLDRTNVTNITMQLRRPVLGAWRLASGEVYFGDQMLDIRVDYDMSIGAASPTTITTYVTNDGAIFGIRRTDGTLELRNLVIRDGELGARATINCNNVEGRPPSASFALPDHVQLAAGEDGLRVSSIVDSSSDPDNDLRYTSWLVDGAYVAPAFVIEPGTHTLRLETRDSRLAYDNHEQKVTISN